MSSEASICRITIQQARLLRQRLLRPDFPPETCIYPGDNAQDTYHAGAFLEGALVGIASAFRDTLPFYTDADIWRLRGMAVLEIARRQGIGRALVLSCIAHSNQLGGELIWCNARVASMTFYQALGFRAQGDKFDIPESGPHYLMWRPLVKFNHP